MVRLLTINEVMDALGMSRPTVMGLVECGKLPMVNVGLGSRKPRYVIREDHLLDFLTHPSLKKKQEREAKKRRLDIGVEQVL